MANPPQRTPADVAAARGTLLMFSSDRPLVVSPSVYQAMKAEPDIADLMDRVVESRPLPKA